MISISVTGTQAALARFVRLAAEATAARPLLAQAPAEVVQEDAKARAPVLTGALRDSIVIESDGADKLVGSHLEYAGFVEYGTSDTPRQPYLRPAADAARSQAPGLAAAVLRAVLR